MNIIEETPGIYRVEATGLSIREIKNILELEYGALIWTNGGAYPADGIKLQFKQVVPKTTSAKPE